jgi:hypothetical protein
MIRRPWAIPLLVLLLLTVLALLDPRETPRPADGMPVSGAIEVLGGIEPDPRNPVQSIVRIQWSTFPGANRYEVRFFSMDMDEVARHSTGSENAMTLDLREVWHPVAPARALMWRVVALRDNEALALSALQTLRLP